MEDKRIIELFFYRSEKAISETSKKYGNYCFAISYNILQNKEDAEECVNDTYIKIWNSIPPNRPNNLKTYVGKIVRNLSLNKYEKNNAKKRNNGQVSLLLDELLECIPDLIENEKAITDSIIIKNAIEKFLDRLPKQTRQIFVRRYWYMSSTKDIAKDFKMTESNVNIILFRAREKLKHILEQEGVLYE